MDFIVGDIFGPPPPKGDINVVVNDARNAIRAAGRLVDNLRAADQAATNALSNLVTGGSTPPAPAPAATVPQDPSMTQGAANLVAPTTTNPAAPPTAEQLAAVQQLAAVLQITPTWRADP